MAANRKVDDHVFQHLVDKAAFLDKLEIGLWGVKRQRFLPVIDTKPSKPIGGNKRLYGRSIHGLCRTTGNPFEFRYGRLRHFRRLAPFRLVLHSGRTPLTGAQVSLVAGALLRQGYRSQVSQLELTFDITGYPLSYFRQHLFTRARRKRELHDHLGRQTFYAGGPRSPWQLIVYQKTDQVVRVEFKIRRGFLHDRGIESVHDLLRFRRLNLWALVSFREFDDIRLRLALRRVSSSRYNHLFFESPRRLSLQTLATFLRWRLGINPDSVLKTSGAEHVLRRMQRNFIW
jgi:hypothetical protein